MTCAMPLTRQRYTNELGWSPETTFDEGIKKTVDWYMNNKQWWERHHHMNTKLLRKKCIPTDK